MFLGSLEISHFRFSEVPSSKPPSHKIPNFFFSFPIPSPATAMDSGSQVPVKSKVNTDSIFSFPPVNFSSKFRRENLGFSLKFLSLFAFSSAEVSTKSSDAFSPADPSYLQNVILLCILTYIHTYELYMFFLKKNYIYFSLNIHTQTVKLLRPRKRIKRQHDRSLNVSAYV